MRGAPGNRRPYRDHKVGNFSITFQDLTVPVGSLPITRTRTYDTRQDGEPLDFGYGWNLGYQGLRLQQSARPGLGWQVNSYGTFD